MTDRSKYLATAHLRQRRRRDPRCHTHLRRDVCASECRSFIKVGGLNDIIPLVLISSVFGVSEKHGTMFVVALK